jgi:hypothetical protein
MPTLAEIQARLFDELRYVDDVAQIVLKGHLVMEELMNEALGTYLLHEEFLEPARLQFSQKLALCRGISTSEHNNNMWNLINSINALRNKLSHSLDGEQRSKKIQILALTYAQEFPGELPEGLEEMSRDSAICIMAVSGCLGFLHAFVEEIKRLRGFIIALDRVMNNHRDHKGVQRAAKGGESNEAH